MPTKRRIEPHSIPLIGTFNYVTVQTVFKEPNQYVKLNCVLSHENEDGSPSDIMPLPLLRTVPPEEYANRTTDDFWLFNWAIANLGLTLYVPPVQPEENPQP